MKKALSESISQSIAASVAAIVLAGLLSTRALASDCNENGIDDAQEIASGTSPDCNSNGVPDECDMRLVFGAEAARPLPLAEKANRAIATDMDGDERADIVVTQPYAGTVQVLLARDGGVFEALEAVAVHGMPYSAAAADLDEDGTLDLVVAGAQETEDAGGISVLRGRGDGTFESVPEAYAPGGGHLSVASADFDDDGRLDLASCGTSGFHVLLGNGDGTFGAPAAIDVGSTVYALSLGDLNGDGAEDIVGAGEHVVHVVIGLGDGTFQAPQAYPAGRPRSLALADFDLDGDLDVATASSDESAWGILRGNGDGTLSPVESRSEPRRIFSVVARDFDGDGKPDLCFAYSDQGYLSILPGLGNGTFGAETACLAGNRPYAVTSADLDSDGALDLLATNDWAGDLTIVHGKGGGEFRSARAFAEGPVQPNHVRIADLNGDGILDVAGISAGHSNGQIRVLFGTEKGALAGGPSRYFGDYVKALDIADLTGDGRVDLVVGRERAEDGAPSVYPGRGDGTFGDPTEIPYRRGLAALLVADLSGDGLPDLVAVSAETSDLAVLLGSPEGAFGTPIEKALPGTIGGLLAADLDGDGDLDLAAVVTYSDNVTVFLGGGDGTLGDGADYAAGDGPSAIASGDFDEDGHLDLAAAAEVLPEVTVLPGLGDGTFGATRYLSMRNKGYSIEAADVDRDGHLDLVLGTYPGGASILLGKGDGTFEDEIEISIGGGTEDVHVLDVDRDGFGDLIAPLSSSHRIWVTFNATHPISSADCNQNGTPDECDIARGTSPDVDANGVPDTCQTDCDRDGVPDAFELSTGAAADCDDNGALDSCDIERGRAPDCNRNGVPDGCDLSGGASADIDGDGIPDECETDCNRNGIPDSHEIGEGLAEDCNENGIPDACDVAGGESGDCNSNGIPDECDVAPVIRLEAGRRFEGPTGRKLVLALDANGDGHLDAAAAVPGTGEIVLSAGNGRGSLDLFFRATIAGKYEIVDLQSADLDADGAGDLIATRDDSSSIAVLRGKKDGGFHDPLLAPVGGGPCDVAIGDADEDGKLDLLVANATSQDISLLLGKGDGTFEAEARIAAIVSSSSVVVLDANLDGHLDFAVTESTAGYISLFTGAGDGTFLRTTRRRVGSGPMALLGDDLDGDGLPDLACILSGESKLSILGGNGDGTFRQPLSSDVESRTTCLIAGDIDADGATDLVTASGDTGTVHVLRGTGGGAFGEVQAFPGGWEPATLGLGDFDEDGRVDLVSADLRDLLLFQGRGDGTFLAASTPARLPDPSGAEIADIDLDGRPDIVLAGGWSPELTVLFGRGDGTTEDPVAVPVGSTPVWVLAAELDGGPAPELAVSSKNDQVFILDPRGDRTFGLLATLDAGRSPRDLAAEDFDGDGRLDLAVCASQSHEVRSFLGNGDGTFRAGGQVAISYASGLRAFDADEDGVVDLFVSAYRSETPDGTVAVLRGRGDGTFRKPQILGVGDDLRDVATADLDLDGHMDFVAASEKESIVFLGIGAGAFSERLREPAAWYPRDAALEDIDGDGLPDLVVTEGAEPGVLHVRSGRGDGTFRPALRFVVGAGASLIEIGDLDLDGRPDVVTLNDMSDDVSMGRNSSGPRTDGDRDQDGIPDRCEEGSCRIPGDCTEDSILGMADAVCVLRTLFLNDPEEFPCGDGSGEDPSNLALLDWQGDGLLDLSDGIGILGFLFLGDPPHVLAVPGAEMTACVNMAGCPPLEERP